MACFRTHLAHLFPLDHHCIFYQGPEYPARMHPSPWNTSLLSAAQRFSPGMLSNLTWESSSQYWQRFCSISSQTEISKVSQALMSDDSSHKFPIGLLPSGPIEFSSDNISILFHAKLPETHKTWYKSAPVCLGFTPFSFLRSWKSFEGNKWKPYPDV